MKDEASLEGEGNQVANPDEWRRQHDATSETINRTMLGLTALSLFCMVTLAAPDKVLTVEQATVPILFASARAGFDRFLFVAPLTLIGIGIDLHIFVGYWEALNTSPLRVPLPFLFNIDRRYSRLMASFLFYWLGPAVLWDFAWKARPKPRPGQFEFEFVLFLWIVWACSMLWLYVRRSPQRKKRIVATLLSVSAVAIGLLLLYRGRSLNLTEADLRNLSLQHRHLRGAYMGGANLEAASLRGANLSQADLTEAILDRALIEGADLREANLHNATLVGAYLGDAKLKDANLSGARLFSATGLTQEQVDLACVDERTTLPEGFRKPKPCMIR